MKIAVLCPVGPLDRFGYQYNHMTTIRSFSKFADRVYLYSSSRNRANIDNVLAAFSNVTYISDERTWFSLDEQGNEFFRVADFERNNDVALTQAKADHMDAAVHVHINQYIEKGSMISLKEAIKTMLKRKFPFEWLYRRYQLVDKLFHADTRHPWILNLSIDNPYLLRADAIQHKDNGERYIMKHANYKGQDKIAVRDAGMEMTLQDLADVRNFTRGYVELNPNANPVFEWEHYQMYYMEKFNQKILSNAKLGVFGREIAQGNRPDFVSNLFLLGYTQKPKNYGLVNKLKKIVSRNTYV